MSRGDHIKDRPWAVDHMDMPAELAGWDERDADVVLPIMDRELSLEEVRLIEETNKIEARQHLTKSKDGPVLPEFPLYYYPGEQRKLQESHGRRYLQVRAAAERACEGSLLVLMTPDYKVMNAKSMKKLVWIYFKTWLKSLWPKRKKGIKLPKY